MSAENQYKHKITFIKLEANFRHPFTNKKLCKKTFDGNSVKLLPGYSHNRYTLWGILPSGERKKLSGKGGAFLGRENGTVEWWHNNNFRTV